MTDHADDIGPGVYIPATRTRSPSRPSRDRDGDANGALEVDVVVVPIFVIKGLAPLPRLRPRQYTTAVHLR